jgi:hypothetical protein
MTDEFLIRDSTKLRITNNYLALPSNGFLTPSVSAKVGNFPTFLSGLIRATTPEIR